MKYSSRLSRLQKVGLVSVGVVTGAVIAATGFASAADNTTTPAPASQSQQSEDSNGTTQTPDRPGAPDGHDMNRPAEEPLTGDTATKVEAAVMAKYPGATIERMEKDANGEGVFEAHIIKADGTDAVVFLDTSFAVTGEKVCGPDGGPHGGPQGGPRSEGPGHEGPGHKEPGHEGHGPMGGPGNEGPGHGGPSDEDGDGPASPSSLAPSASTPSA